MSDVLKLGDITPEESEAWNAYWATRDEWGHFSDVLPELRAFIAGRRDGSRRALEDAANATEECPSGSCDEHHSVFGSRAQGILRDMAAAVGTNPVVSEEKQ